MAINTPHTHQPASTTIVWGTEGRLGTGGPGAGSIVESIAITPRNAGPIGEIEDGNGASVVNVMLDDGFDAKVTCVFDSIKTWPVLGATVTLSCPPYAGGTGTLMDYVCFVAGNHEISMSRKKEATITLNLRYRPGVSVV